MPSSPARGASDGLGLGSNPQARLLPARRGYDTQRTALEAGRTIRAQQLVGLPRPSSAETRDAPGSLQTIVVFHLLLRKRLAVRTPWITVEKAMAYQAPLMPIPTIITRT
jgi:hypothetical protein